MGAGSTDAEGRALTPRMRPITKRAGAHDSTSGPAEKAVGRAFMTLRQPDDRRVLLLAHGLGGMLAHRDLFGADDRLAALVRSREGLDHVDRAAEQNLQVGVGGQGRFDARQHDRRAGVSADRVDGNGHRFTHFSFLSARARSAEAARPH